MSPSWMQPVFVAPRWHGMGVHNLQSPTFGPSATSFMSSFQDESLEGKLQKLIDSLNGDTIEERAVARRTLEDSMTERKTREAYKRVLSQDKNKGLREGTGEQALQLQRLGGLVQKQDELRELLDHFTTDPAKYGRELRSQSYGALNDASDRGMTEMSRTFEKSLTDYVKGATGAAKEVGEAVLMGHRSSHLREAMRGTQTELLAERLMSPEHNELLQKEIDKLNSYAETPDSIKKLLNATKEAVKSVKDADAADAAIVGEAADLVRRARSAIENLRQPPRDGETVDEWKTRRADLEKDVEDAQKDVDKFNKEQRERKKEEKEEKQEMGYRRSEPRTVTRIVHRAPATASMAPTPPTPSSYVGDLISMGLRLGASGTSVRPPVATLGGSGGGSVTAATSVTS